MEREQKYSERKSGKKPRGELSERLGQATFFWSAPIGGAFPERGRGTEPTKD